MNDNDETLRDLIGEYVDDDVSEENRRRVEAALLKNPELAWDALTQRIVRDRLRQDGAEAVASDAFRARLLRKLYADNPHVTQPTETEEIPGQYSLPLGNSL
jgi:anti-sigma factor RsiW